MNFKKLSSFLTIAIFSLTGFKAFSADVHGVFCGSELRPNYVEIADEYMKNNPGVNVTLEAVPWGTCQDKVINLAIAGELASRFNCSTSNPISPASCNGKSSFVFN